MALTAKKRRFVEEYLVDLNISAAAIRAGYSAASARQIGSLVMQEPEVAAAVAEAMAARSRRTAVSAERVVRELARIAFSDIRDTVTWGPGGILIRDADDISDDAAAALVEVSQTTQGRQRTLKVKLADKMGALRLLAAHTGVGVTPDEDEEGDVADAIADDPDPPRDDRGGS